MRRKEPKSPSSAILYPDGLDECGLWRSVRHAIRAANATRAETTKLLQDGIAAGTEMIRSLNAEQLQKTAALPMGQMTNEQIVQLIMIGHTGIHSAGIKAATA